MRSQSCGSFRKDPSNLVPTGTDRLPPVARARVGEIAGLARRSGGQRLAERQFRELGA